MRRFTLIRTVLLLLAFAAGAWLQAPGRGPADPQARGAAVLADPADPYYPLAQEIARAEGLPLAGSLAEAAALHPATVLWVASPAQLSDRAMVAAGQAIGSRGSALSIGLITGATPEEARALWQRARQVKGERVAAANAVYPSAGLPTGRLSLWAGDSLAAVQPSLQLSDLQQALADCDYVTFTGHGSRGYWRLDEETTLRPGDLPALGSIVVGTASCNTFRPWEPENIALAFASRGAAAYAGFSYSPNEGYLIGEFDGLPFRYTWPGYPIGHVVQVQGRGTLQGFARFPYYWLLGDPRIALQGAPPYRVLRDGEEAGVRTLVLQEAPAGVLPVRIEGGAAYSYVEAAGTGAWVHAPFYNARLQMADIGGDRYLLVQQGGGELTIRLHRRAPILRIVADMLTASLDHTLIIAFEVALPVGVVAALAAGFSLWRRRGPIRLLLPAALVGLGYAALLGLYAWLHVGQATITSKLISFNPAALAGAFLLGTSGALIALPARSGWGREAAVWVATFPAWGASLFGLAAVGYINLLLSSQLGTGIYNLALAILPLAALAVLSLALDLGYRVARRAAFRPGHADPPAG